jgi:hypothetical protein
MLERVPKECECRTTPIQMIAYCKYTHGEMNIFGASPTLCHISLLIQNSFGHMYT